MNSHRKLVVDKSENGVHRTISKLRHPNNKDLLIMLHRRWIVNTNVNVVDYYLNFFFRHHIRHFALLFALLFIGEMDDADRNPYCLYHSIHVLSFDIHSNAVLVKAAFCWSIWWLGKLCTRYIIIRSVIIMLAAAILPFLCHTRKLLEYVLIV